MWSISANRVTLSITTWRFGKASEVVVIRTSSLRNCDLNDLVGVSLVWNIFRLKSFLVSFSDAIHSIGDWSVVFEVDCEIYRYLSASQVVFRNSSLKTCWSSEGELWSNRPCRRSLCLPVWISSTSAAVRGCRWSVVIWLIHPTQQSSLLLYRSSFAVIRGNKSFTG